VNALTGLVLASVCHLVACKPQETSADAAPPSSSVALGSVDANGRSLQRVDEAEIRAVCLLAKMPTPPEVTSNNAYDIGILATSRLSERYPWVIVDAAFHEGEKRQALADRYRLDLEVALSNTPINAVVCRKDWETSRDQGVITIVLRTAGTESSGDYLVMGGTPRKLTFRNVTKVSHSEARKTALAMGFDAFGRKLRSVQADSEWAALARTAD
jgi:hypothetical protein